MCCALVGFIRFLVRPLQRTKENYNNDDGEVKNYDFFIAEFDVIYSRSVRITDAAISFQGKALNSVNDFVSLLLFGSLLLLLLK